MAEFSTLWFHYFRLLKRNLWCNLVYPRQLWGSRVSKKKKSKQKIWWNGPAIQALTGAHVAPVSLASIIILYYLESKPPPKEVSLPPATVYGWLKWKGGRTIHGHHPMQYIENIEYLAGGDDHGSGGRTDRRTDDGKFFLPHFLTSWGGGQWKLITLWS